jgi:hypothetical protein
MAKRKLNLKKKKVNTENKKEKKVKEKPYQKGTDDIFELQDVSETAHILRKL